MQRSCLSGRRDSFTHHDPLEDTERFLHLHLLLLRPRFTHHDPLEDTESVAKLRVLYIILMSFTHHDPLEDTERRRGGRIGELTVVSPITIRLRILKGNLRPRLI